MENSELTIIFIIGRDERGHKEADHILPLLYLLDKFTDLTFSAIGVIYGYRSLLSDKSDKRIRLISEIRNTRFCDPYNVNNDLLFRFLMKMRSISNWKLKHLISLLIWYIYKGADKKIDWQAVAGPSFVNATKPLIITLNYSQELEEVVCKLKAINPKAKWMVFPHGAAISDNNMLWTSHMERQPFVATNSSFNELDYHLFSSQRDFDASVKSGLPKEIGSVIGSPRFCSEWMREKKVLGLDAPVFKTGKNSKVRILFLIPKFFINIFHEELLRTIEFISGYGEIDLVLNRASKGFPKIGNRILSRSNVWDYLISNEYPTGALIDWADAVIHVGTGIIFEPFMKEKIVVFPRYLTCNTLICELYKAGWTLKNRDDLREFCNMAIGSLPDTRKKYFSEHRSANKKYLLDFVNGGPGTVVNKIGNVFREIRNNI